MVDIGFVEPSPKKGAFRSSKYGSENESDGTPSGTGKDRVDVKLSDLESNTTGDVQYAYAEKDMRSKQVSTEGAILF